MKETIAQMLRAEEEAKNTVAQADARSEELVRKAKAEALALETAAQQKAQAESKKMIDEGVRSARERRVVLLEEIDRDIQRLRNVPSEKAEAAKNLIRAALIGQ